MKIYKYELPDMHNVLLVPADWTPISAGMQGNSFVLWAIVKPESPNVYKHVKIVGTGWEFEKMMETMGFVQTIQDGAFVWHVFAEI